MSTLHSLWLCSFPVHPSFSQLNQYCCSITWLPATMENFQKFYLLHDYLAKCERKAINLSSCPISLIWSLWNLSNETLLYTLQYWESRAVRHGPLSMCCSIRKPPDFVWRGEHSAGGWVRLQLPDIQKYNYENKHNFMGVLTSDFNALLNSQIILSQAFLISLWSPSTYL